MKKETAHVYWVNEQAITIQVPAPVSLAQQQRIWALGASFQARNGITEIVPAMNNLTLAFDESLVDGEQLIEELQQGWKSLVAETRPGRLVEIPVRYGGQWGPDLADIVAHTGLSVDEVIRIHSDAEYTVFFIGFQPGFAYLGGMPSQLTTPRRSSPRQAVPAGSVAIGGTQTGVYPKTSPGGWQLLGHTDAVLFDPAREQPSLWMPGDRVRFVVTEVDHV
ncbi:5-oxoprolinase subunit PxpB [Dickeya chrysanthemi]|uniref:5-oxoprolinase subunit PxpB n=1 Tax=Dickeya chrysanthemi TaxID=556 RepID=A0ABU8JM19_DICCH|nr:5-oxoprolinase subunit PxpB [Dickeya chrysanthemi]MCA7007584.1 5-oxoprolinase subunit PxpB [Dickeya chrysanthemi]